MLTISRHRAILIFEYTYLFWTTQMRHRAIGGFRGQGDALHYENGQNWLKACRQKSQEPQLSGLLFIFVSMLDF